MLSAFKECCIIFNSICGGHQQKKEKKNHSPEHHTLQVKRVLYDTGCGHPHPQHILLSWQIPSIRDSIQVIQIANSTGGG